MLELLEFVEVASEAEREDASAVPEHHRILIAAAVVAALGENARVCDIRPVREPYRSRWARQYPVSLDAARKTVRHECRIHVDPVPENQEQ